MALVKELFRCELKSFKATQQLLVPVACQYLTLSALSTLYVPKPRSGILAPPGNVNESLCTGPMEPATPAAYATGIDLHAIQCGNGHLLLAASFTSSCINKADVY